MARLCDDIFLQDPAVPSALLPTLTSPCVCTGKVLNKVPITRVPCIHKASVAKMIAIGFFSLVFGFLFFLRRFFYRKECLQ